MLNGNSPHLKITSAKLVDLMLRRKLLQRAVAVDHLVAPLFLPAEDE